MNGLINNFLNLFKNSFKEIGDNKELQETAGEVIGNLVEGAAENVGESASEVAEEITSQISETLKAHDGGIDITDQIFDIDSAKDIGDEIADLMEDIAEEQVGASEIITNAKAAEMVATVTNTEAVNAETGSKAKNTTANIKETASVWALVKAKLAEAKARAAAFAATPLGMAAIAAAIIVIGYATTKLVLWLKSADHAIEKSKKLREEAQNLAQSLKEEADNASETAKSFRELADSYEEAIAGSEEYYNIANQIAELDPTLVVGYTSNGDAILADTSAIYEQVNAYEALSKAKADASKEATDELIKTDVEQYDILNQKKTDNDQKIKEQKELLDSYYQHLNSLTEGTAEYNKYKNDLIPAKEDIYQNLLNESKKYSEEIQNINNELVENYTYLFDEFDETLSQSEQETEKHLRQFVSNIGRESHLSPDQFRDLYAKAGLVNEKLWDELFSIKNEDLNEEQYRETAQNLYNKIINELIDNDFQLDKNGQATLKVMLGIDEKSIVNNNQRTKNFANKYFKGFDRSNDNARARDWYDQLIGSDKDIVDKATDFADILKQVENDHPGNTLVQNLDLALEKTKKISEEIKTINADFTPQDLSEKVTSQLTSIESLYGTFYENILNGSKTRLDLDDVEGLRSALVETEEQAGVTGEQFEEFERIVSDGTHSAQEMQDAFDILSTQFVDATLSLNGYTSKNKELIKAQLEEAGYTKESVDAYVEYKTALHEVDEAVQNNLIHINSNVKAMLSEAEAAGIDKSALIEYYTTKLTADMLSMSTVEDVIQLANELEALGINCDKLREYIALKQTAGSIEATTGFNGTTKNTAAMIAQQKGQTNVNPNGVVQDLQKQLLDNINLVNKTTKEAAGGGGSEAGDAYVEAFEKELQELNDLKEAGIISEREYLERLRDLNQRYFKDKAQYAKEYAKYEKQYLQGMSDLYNKAIGGAISVLNFQKNKLEKERDKAVKALEKERDAAIKPVQDQIDALEDEQKALEKERDAMQKANDERERAINLQKAQYELERANAQRTRLIYKNGQMQYVNDYQEVRDAKKNLEDALFDEKMAKMDEQIDNINEQIEGLNDQLDEINKHYDDLIKSTEEFYDEQIEQLQDMIDMWEEFQAQMELSEALAALDEFGITMDDILSGNPEAFAKLTQGYAACQAALTGNISEIAQALGTSEEEIRRWIEEIGADFQNAFSGDIDTSGIDKISNAITGGGGGGVSTGAGAGAGIGSGSTGGGLVGDIQTLSGGVQDLNTNLGAINSVPMENLANSIERIVDVLGEEGFAGIFKMPENFNLANMVQQFSDMADKISGITTAITGGGGQSKGTTDWSDNTDYHSEGGESGEEGDTLLSALSQIGEKQTDIQALSDTFAPEDGSLSSNVETAGKAISDGDSEDSLTGKFIKLKEGAEENVRPVVKMFTMLLMQITMCVTAVEQLTAKMTTLRDVNINSPESPSTFSGTAYASGNWSAKSKGANGVALTGELGEELVVDSKTGRWHTVGTNGAEFAKINPNDIVFNHKQTEALFKNGKINSRGRAYASGNNNRFTSLTPEELSKYNKLDFTKDLAEKLDFGNQKLMNIDKTVSTISNNKTVNNNPVINVNNPTFTCTGVTGEEVLAQIEQSFTGLFTNAYQQSMMR